MAITLGFHSTKFTFISVTKSDHSMDIFRLTHNPVRVILKSEPGSK